MEKEYLVLIHLQRKEHTTQRDIARAVGVGVGTANYMLKKMIRKGLVKTQRINGRSLRYILTPKGLREKTEKTYNYLKRSYAHIVEVTGAVAKMAAEAKKRGLEKIYLYGPRDEVFEIINLALRREEINYRYLEDGQLPEVGDKVLILVWNIKDEEKLGQNFRVVNVLKEI